MVINRRPTISICIYCNCNCEIEKCYLILISYFMFYLYLTLCIIRLKFKLQLFNRNDKRTYLYIEMPFIIILINPIIGPNLMRIVRIRYNRYINLMRIANESRAWFIPLYPYQSICVIFRGKFQRMSTMPGNFRHCWHSLSEPGYVDIDWKKSAIVNIRGFHRLTTTYIYIISETFALKHVFFNLRHSDGSCNGGSQLHLAYLYWSSPHHILSIPLTFTKP